MLHLLSDGEFLSYFRLLGDYTDSPVDFSAMKETISSLDDDLATYQ